ncbi:MAG: hypothetical protein K0R57_66 [Paenibacillaceae bacterium]|jgi:hypothetical protein|nr:hypothetical protein [Paenibacillaceae bacterium]
MSKTLDKQTETRASKNNYDLGLKALGHSCFLIAKSLSTIPRHEVDVFILISILTCIFSMGSF